MAKKRVEIIIIGAGLIGLCSALILGKLKFNVILIFAAFAIAIKCITEFVEPPNAIIIVIALYDLPETSHMM